MLLSHLSLVMAMLTVGSGLDVRSGSDCPSGQAIMGKLAPLLAGHGEEGDVAWIDVAAPEPNQPPSLRMRLIRADSNVLADRQLPIQGTCDEMADTVATVLAAWEAPPAPPALVVEAEPAHAEPARPIDHIRMWLGASAGAGLIGGIAAVGSGELVLEHTGSHLMGRAAMTGQTARQVDLEPGTVSWRRTHGSLGWGWQTARPHPDSYWQCAADIDVLLGWLTVTGHDYSPSAHQTVFEYGFGAGLRGQRNLGGWALWLEARAHVWPTAERTTLTGASSASTQLPRLDVMANLGVSILALR